MVTFFIRAVTCSFGFVFLKQPDNFYAFLCVTLLIWSTGVSNVLCETFYQKKIPNDISGSMRGVFNFFGQIGTLSLTLLSGWFYDHHGPAAPFIVVGVLDFLLVSIMLI